MRAKGESADPLLDMFMPFYDVVDRHSVRVDAPAEQALAAAADVRIGECGVIRGIFKAREMILRSKRDDVVRPEGLLAGTKSMGWGELAVLPGREIVMGAVTKPWEANPVFRALPPDEFTAFDEPGYVKIIWTLRADPAGKDKTIFRTETRAVATDAESRKKFRKYWAFLSPGILMIRKMMLPAMKVEAERRFRAKAA
jgi:hypothetical protein